MKKNYLLGLFMAMLIIGSCKKDDDPTKKEMLTGKNWKLTAWTVDPAYPWEGTLVTNIYAQIDDCWKDDITNFKADGTFTMEEGATKCSSSDPQVFETGTWTFNSDETILVITPNDDDPISNKIVSISSGTVVISYEETENNTKYTYTETYTAQ